jgi:hypothetical protein
MSETPKEILEAWIGMGDRPTDAEMSLVTLERVREAIRAVLARVKEHEDSMVRHFQEEHLAGDGPEIDRWKRHVAGVTATCAVHKAEHERLRQQAEAERDALLAEVERLRLDQDCGGAALYARAKQAEAERDALREVIAGHQAWVDSAPDQWVMRKDAALAPAKTSIVPAWGVTSISGSPQPEPSWCRKHDDATYVCGCVAQPEARPSTEAEARAAMGDGQRLVKMREIKP